MFCGHELFASQVIVQSSSEVHVTACWQVPATTPAPQLMLQVPSSDTQSTAPRHVLSLSQRIAQFSVELHATAWPQVSSAPQSMLQVPWSAVQVMAPPHAPASRQSMSQLPSTVSQLVAPSQLPMPQSRLQVIVL